MKPFIYNDFISHIKVDHPLGAYGGFTDRPGVITLWLNQGTRLEMLDVDDTYHKLVKLMNARTPVEITISPRDPSRQTGDGIRELALHCPIVASYLKSFQEGRCSYEEALVAMVKTYREVNVNLNKQVQACLPFMPAQSLILKKD